MIPSMQAGMYTVKLILKSKPLVTRSLEAFIKHHVNVLLGSSFNLVSSSHSTDYLTQPAGPFVSVLFSCLVTVHSVSP